jgi:hypothetical protein
MPVNWPSDIMDSLDKMNSKDLSAVTLSMAKIAKSIREANKMKRMNVYHRELGSILQRTNPFGRFAIAADRKLISFEVRDLSNLAYAYALVGYNPKFDGGNNLFQKIGDRSITCIKEFNSQDLSNLVWAYSTLNTTHGPVLSYARNTSCHWIKLGTHPIQEGGIYSNCIIVRSINI